VAQMGGRAVHRLTYRVRVSIMRSCALLSMSRSEPHVLLLDSGQRGTYRRRHVKFTASVIALANVDVSLPIHKTTTAARRWLQDGSGRCRRVHMWPQARRLQCPFARYNRC
jgi:hypothetical protein